jgi:hypothetical protein
MIVFSTSLKECLMFNFNFKKAVAIVSLLSFGLLISCLPVQPTSPKISTSYNGPVGTALFKILLAPGDAIFSEVASSAKVYISAGTGDTMSTLTKTLTITDSSVQGIVTGIPAGNSRVFKVSVYDSLDSLQYYGVDTADVIRNTTVDITVNVKRVTGSVDIDGNIIEAGTITDTVFTNITNSAPFGPRGDQRSIVFGNTLLLIGGSNGTTRQNDVWKTTDGINWSFVGNAGFSPRARFGITLFNNKIWVFGGNDSIGFESDVWYSSDTGKTWTCAVTSAHTPVPPMWAPSFGSINGKLMLWGGDQGTGPFSNIWSSPDGINWTILTTSAPFGGRDCQTAVTFNGKLWCISGQGSSAQHADAWYTTDGINWTQATANTGFSSRVAFETVVLNNKIWLIGGSDQTGNLNDIWTSSDGVTWTELSSNGGFPVRNLFSSGVLNNKIYIMAGDGNNGVLSDIWSY